MKKVICVVGPTAVGKSALAVDLALKYNGEIINGDSIQIYRELNIGSAKSTVEEQRGIVHHLLDFMDPGQDYSVAHFQQQARECIEEISTKGKLPIVAGGTGLYIKALLYDYTFLASERQDESDLEELSGEELYALLKELDKKASETIHPNNRKRVIRAIQMARTGTSKSLQEKDQKHEMIYDVLIIGLTADRKLLHERISLRVDQMMQQGLLEEVKDLFSRYPANTKGLDGIGYKEFVPYLCGEKPLEEAVEDIKTHTRQFAKRQYTWFNHQMPVSWYDVTESDWKEKLFRDTEEFLK